MKTIYYYQTFIGLNKLLTHSQDIDVIIVSSIHFGKDKSGKKEIYLNNNIPTNPIFDQLWLDTEKISFFHFRLLGKASFGTLGIELFIFSMLIELS